MNQEQKNWSNQLGKSSESSDGVELRSCMQCGMLFEKTWTGRPKLFCSEKCRRKWHIRDRFWRQEDTEEIMKMLQSGEKVDVIPKWIKEKTKNVTRWNELEIYHDFLNVKIIFKQNGFCIEDSIIKLKLINVLLLC